MGNYWTTIQIPRGIVDIISKYCETDQAANDDLTNKTRVVGAACNLFLNLIYDKNTPFQIFKKLNYESFTKNQKKIVDEHNLNIKKLQNEINEKIRLLSFNQEFVPNFITEEESINNLRCYHPVEDEMEHSEDDFILHEFPDNTYTLHVKINNPKDNSKNIVIFKIKHDVLYCPQGHIDCESVHALFDDKDVRIFLNNKKISLIFPPEKKMYNVNDKDSNSVNDINKS